ncbi:MAG TPA: hypothetical protein VIH90_02175 [Candidatus Saccharimonadales bacterium]
MEDQSGFNNTNRAEVPMAPVESSTESTDLPADSMAAEVVDFQQIQNPTVEEALLITDTANETTRRRGISEIIKNRWEKIRYSNLNKKQQELVSWGSMAVIGALYPFSGGVSEHALEASKQIVGFESLLGFAALQAIAVKKFINITRR